MLYNKAEVIYMDRKMTSGEIAKKVGISQKAVRLYDEKGLLKPTDYSDGNYRLYDKEALLVLENIIALKKIGFSLEEIHDNLISENNINIVDSLNYQLSIMEKRKLEIERSIGCIKGILARTNGLPNWDNVAEIARMIQQDQEADEGHFHALKHAVEKKDWYERIYDSLNIRGNSRVLDLGCGFGKLWRNNWSHIPNDLVIDAVDFCGGWADDFETFVYAHKAETDLKKEISFLWGDVEKDLIWKQLSEQEHYDYIIAHYLFSFIDDVDLLLKRIITVMKKDGVFSCNGFGVSAEHLFWKQLFEKIGLKDSFILDKLTVEEKRYEEFQILLKKYFNKVEKVTLENSMSYDNSDELFERLCNIYVEDKKYLMVNEMKIKNYLEELIMKSRQIVVPNYEEFCHCFQ